MPQSRKGRLDYCFSADSCLWQAIYSPSQLVVNPSAAGNARLQHERLQTVRILVVDISDNIWIQQAPRINNTMVQNHTGQQRKLWLILGFRESRERRETHLTTREPTGIELNLTFLSSLCRFRWDFTDTTMVRLGGVDRRAYGRLCNQRLSCECPTAKLTGDCW